jgi:hypothetical protein
MYHGGCSSSISPNGNYMTANNPDIGMTDLLVPTPVRLEAPAGRQILQVFADGYERAAKVVDVPDGGEAEITVTLRTAGHVRIEVRDGEGKPASGYRLAVFAPDGEELEYDLRIVDVLDDEVASPPLWADPNLGEANDDRPEIEAPEGTIGKNQAIPGGDLTLKNLPPGLYRIRAEKEGINPVEETVEVKASGTTRVELTLR